MFDGARRGRPRRLPAQEPLGRSETVSQEVSTGAAPASLGGDRVDRTPPSVLARLLRGEAGALTALLRESLEALAGRPVQLEALRADHSELSQLFGGRDLFVFPFVDGDGGPLPMFLALDHPAAVATGAAFSLMSADQARAVLASGEVPAVLLDAICEVAGIVAGSAGKLVHSRAPGPARAVCRGQDLLRITPGAWPALVGEIDYRVPWDVLGFRLAIDGAEAGALLLGSSERLEGPISPASEEEADTAEVLIDDLAIGGERRAGSDGAPAPASVRDNPPERLPGIPRGIRVQVVGDPSDLATANLRATLAEAGCQLMPVYSAGGAGPQASALFIVSRSPLDLRSRLESALVKRRAGLVVACSDRPTIDLVRAARAGTADSFLVLPADRARLRYLFQRFAEVSLP
jgi:hypothetical protein